MARNDIKSHISIIYSYSMIIIFRVCNNRISDLLGERDSDMSDLRNEDDAYDVVIMPPEEDAFAASDEDLDMPDGETEGH